jgi:type VI secretion system protein ImpK
MNKRQQNKIIKECMAEKTEIPKLLECFEAFYQRVVEQKQAIITTITHDFSPKNTDDTQETSADQSSKGTPQASTAEVQIQCALNILQDFLKEQEARIQEQQGLFARSAYKEAQYIMAALADEILLSIENMEVRSFLEYNLLEQKLFGTHIAGERFFTNLDSFLAEKNPLNKELGYLYLSALGLGFLGKYRTLKTQTDELDQYRERLFQTLYDERPSLFTLPQMLFPDVLGSTLIIPRMQPSSAYKKWSVALATTLGIYMLISYGLWYSVTAPLRSIIRIILSNIDIV